jgi:hypothetical protein
MRMMILIVLVLMTASPAGAASIFNKPKKDNVLPDPVVTQEQQAAPEPMPEPQPAPAPAEPPQTSQPAPETMDIFAERYLANCAQQKHPVLKGESLRLLCACSAAKLKETMTVDEVKTMMENTPEGLAQRNRMAIYVYAPCMEYPAKALMLHRCGEYQAKLQANSSLDGEAICACFANNMALYTAANAQGVMAKQLTENPNDPDPMGKFLNSTDYKAQTDKAFLACVNTNGGLGGGLAAPQ